MCLDPMFHPPTHPHPPIAEQEEGIPWKSAVFSRDRMVITELTDARREEKGSHNYLPSGAEGNT